MHRFVLAFVLLIVFSQSALATSRSYNVCDERTVRFLDASPQKPIWEATTYSALGASVVYGIDAATRTSRASEVPVIALLFTVYAVGFFTRPQICDEVKGKNVSGVKEGEGGVLGRSELKFPEDPKSAHRASVISALVFTGTTTGMGIWLLLSASSDVAKGLIGAVLATFAATPSSVISAANTSSVCKLECVYLAKS